MGKFELSLTEEQKKALQMNYNSKTRKPRNTNCAYSLIKIYPISNKQTFKKNLEKLRKMGGSAQSTFLACAPRKLEQLSAAAA